MRKEKGITLIALIITIIVMLILVAVSITIVINSGLLNKAKSAGDSYKANAAYESNYAENQITINGNAINSIDEYVSAR